MHCDSDLIELTGRTRTSRACAAAFRSFDAAESRQQQQHRKTTIPQIAKRRAAVHGSLAMLMAALPPRNEAARLTRSLEQRAFVAFSPRLDDAEQPLAATCNGAATCCADMVLLAHPQHGDYLRAHTLRADDFRHAHLRCARSRLHRQLASLQKTGWQPTKKDWMQYGTFSHWMARGPHSALRRCFGWPKGSSC